LVSSTNQPPRIHSALADSSFTSSIMPQLHRLLELNSLLTGKREPSRQDLDFLTSSTTTHLESSRSTIMDKFTHSWSTESTTTSPLSYQLVLALRVSLLSQRPKPSQSDFHLISSSEKLTIHSTLTYFESKWKLIHYLKNSISFILYHIA
jgi:hypothetical protein